MSFRKITFRRVAPKQKTVKAKQLKAFKVRLKSKSGVRVAHAKEIR